MTRILLAGDGFVTPTVLKDAVEARGIEADLRTIESAWPDPPFSDFGGVREALGDEDELIAALEGCEVCFTHTWPITRKVMAACPDLRLVTVCRGGPVNVDIDAATDLGITVTFAPGRNATATAEHTIAMIMAAVRQVAQRDSEVKKGVWRSDYYKYEQVGPEVSGSTVGVIGYGAVGSRVAKVMAAMGAHVLVYDPWFKGDLPEGMERTDSLEDLFSRSNIVTIHARVTDDNYHMINKSLLDLMPPNAIVVNCARGPLMDYEALADAVESGQLFAAALDCAPEEPLPADHRLLEYENITFTPHLGGASKQAAHFAAKVGAEDIARFLDGEQPLHCANPSTLPNHD